MIWTFYDQVVKAEKGWVEQAFVLLIIAALPSNAGLTNEYISYWISKITYLGDHLAREQRVLDSYAEEQLS